jgi:hypothetical protein
MKKILLSVVITVVCANVMHAQGKVSYEVIVGTKQPSPAEANMMRAEEQKHPNIDKAVHDIDNALKALNAAPDDFGGHKGQAINDLKASYVSLRKALYFRIFEDRR